MSKIEQLEGMILCGGEAWRLKPQTFVSKPMLPFGNKTLLEYQLAWLLSNKISPIVIASDQKYEINKAFEKHVTWVLDEGRGTGGAVLVATDSIQGNQFYLMNVDDIILGFSPRVMLFPDEQAKVLVAKPTLRCGRSELRQDLVIRFQEKPILDFYVSTGHYLLKKHIVNRYFPDYGNLEDKVLPKLVKRKLLHNTRLKGTWITINNYKDYELAKGYLS